MIRISVSAILLASLVVAAGASNAVAGSGGYLSVPEISPSTASGALAVLAGTGLMIAERLRFRRK